MLHWLSNLRRRMAIKKYSRKLGPLLRKHYGRSRQYTSGQIQTSVHVGGLPAAYICYGYAMFMSRNDFDALHQEMGEECDYDVMRQEISDVCFSGGSFSTVDVVAYGDSFDSGSGADGGGGNSGGGDGG